MHPLHTDHLLTIATADATTRRGHAAHRRTVRALVAARRGPAAELRRAGQASLRRVLGTPRPTPLVTP